MEVRFPIPLSIQQYITSLSVCTAKPVTSTEYWHRHVPQKIIKKKEYIKPTATIRNTRFIQTVVLYFIRGPTQGEGKAAIYTAYSMHKYQLAVSVFVWFAVPGQLNPTVNHLQHPLPFPLSHKSIIKSTSEIRSANLDWGKSINSTCVS